jgi:hypothetical protein
MVEVCVRLRHLIPVVGVAAFTASVLAQSPTNPGPETPAQSTAPAVPTPGNAGNVPAMPAYGAAPAQAQTSPMPTKTPPPVVAPATPTQQAPYGAMPAYNGGTGTVQTQPAYVPAITVEKTKPNHDGSTYIPMDSWVYPEMSRLYSLGFANTVFLSMRPWTRQSLLHILDDSESEIRNSDNEEAKEILVAVRRELEAEIPNGTQDRGDVYGLKSAYTRLMGISGTPLRDSYHLGQTIANDYGRPYQNGFNNVTGFETLAEKGRFSFYFRGEYQHASAAAGYSLPLTEELSALDTIPYSGYNLNQATIPTGPIGAQNPLRIMEATLSFHLLGHEISGGKSDEWLGPAQGGSMAWSNNAENIYAFKIDRVEPLHIPYLSAILGPVRYEFHYGSLKGHTDPNSPYVHSEMFAFRPTSNFEFAFQRTVIFGGAGHEPVNLHSFLRSFFSTSDTEGVEYTKFTAQDPGARFSDFSATYRLPYMRKTATFYVDSFAHDDVTPISAPRRAAFRTGLYISHFRGLPKLDLRVEAADTDCRTSRCQAGTFYYFEGIQLQGYTNKGYIFGDSIGREGKGGQAWLTYHLSGNESLQLEYLNKKNDNDFIANGTTQNQFKASVMKRYLHDSVELNAWFQYERWKAPIYRPGAQNDTVTAVQVTFFPKLKTKASF